MNKKIITKNLSTLNSWKWIASLFCILFFSTMAGYLLALGEQARVTYSCSPSINGTPRTIAKTPRGKIAVIIWVSDYFKDSGFDPQTRCDLVSKNFQKYQDDSTLNYITTGIMNKQRVVCVSSKDGGGCTGQLFTLHPDDDASRVLQQLSDIGSKARTAPLYQSSGSPRIYIDMKKFLSEAPVIND